MEGRKKKVFQALVSKSLALRGMERVVGINRMLGGRVDGRERELFLVPPEKVSWHLFCAYLGLGVGHSEEMVFKLRAEGEQDSPGWECRQQSLWQEEMYGGLERSRERGAQRRSEKKM